MNKFLKNLGAAAFMGAMLVFAGCGGGGDGGSSDNGGNPPPPSGLITTGGTVSAADGNKTFAFGAGTYTYTISGFGAGDVLSFPTVAGAAPTVQNLNYTDGIVDVVFVTADSTITVELTGLSAANDGALRSVADFATVFGAGTITNHN